MEETYNELWKEDKPDLIPINSSTGIYDYYNTRLDINGSNFSGTNVDENAMDDKMRADINSLEMATQVRYHGGKVAHLGIPQDTLTPIYKSNVSTIGIVEAEKSTEQSWHMNIRSFAIQQIPGIVNPADALTKPYCIQGTLSSYWDTSSMKKSDIVSS